MVVAPAVADESTRDILVLYSSTPTLPQNVTTDRGLREALDRPAKPRVEVFTEYLDVPRFSGDAYVRTVATYLREKYSMLPPKVIVASGDTALAFLPAPLFGLRCFHFQSFRRRHFMRKLHLALLAAAVVSGTALAQTPAPAAAPAKAPAAMAAAAGTVKAIQPGLLEVAGPRVNEVMAVGIEKITAVPGKGRRSIAVQSQWGDSFYGWPKNVKPVAFTIEIGKPAGGATISAPGFTDANKADYKAAIEAVIPNAIAFTNDSRKWMEGSGK